MEIGLTGVLGVIAHGHAGEVNLIVTAPALIPHPVMGAGSVLELTRNDLHAD